MPTRLDFTTDLARRCYEEGRHRNPEIVGIRIYGPGDVLLAEWTPKPPKVICAAIREPGGTVWMGKRHDDVIFVMAQFGRDPKLGEQGFVDAENHFLTREEAALRAHQIGQIPVKKPRLYSEDLY